MCECGCVGEGRRGEGEKGERTLLSGPSAAFGFASVPTRANWDSSIAKGGGYRGGVGKELVRYREGMPQEGGQSHTASGSDEAQSNVCVARLAEDIVADVDEQGHERGRLVHAHRLPKERHAQRSVLLLRHARVAGGGRGGPIRGGLARGPWEGRVLRGRRGGRRRRRVVIGRRSVDRRAVRGRLRRRVEVEDEFVVDARGGGQGKGREEEKSGKVEAHGEEGGEEGSAAAARRPRRRIRVFLDFFISHRTRDVPGAAPGPFPPRTSRRSYSPWRIGRPRRNGHSK